MVVAVVVIVEVNVEMEVVHFWQRSGIEIGIRLGRRYWR